MLITVEFLHWEEAWPVEEIGRVFKLNRLKQSKDVRVHLSRTSTVFRFHQDQVVHKIGSRFMVKCNIWEFRIAKRLQAGTVFGFGGRMGLKPSREAGQFRQIRGSGGSGRADQE